MQNSQYIQKKSDSRPKKTNIYANYDEVSGIYKRTRTKLFIQGQTLARMNQQHLPAD